MINASLVLHGTLEKFNLSFKLNKGVCFGNQMRRDKLDFIENSKPGNHLKENENHTFICSIKCTAPENTYHKSIYFFPVTLFIVDYMCTLCHPIHAYIYHGMIWHRG